MSLNDEFKRRVHRSVVCSEACEGIPTEALESGVITDMLDTLRDLLPTLIDLSAVEEELDGPIDRIKTILKITEGGD